MWHDWLPCVNFSFWKEIMISSLTCHVKIKENNKFFWESCVFMGQYGNNIVFGTQVCESWKTSVNVETYIRFMHSEPAVFFLPSLPLQVSTSAAHLSTGWNWTGFLLQNQILSFPQKHPRRPTVHPPFLSFGTHSKCVGVSRCNLFDVFGWKILIFLQKE